MKTLITAAALAIAMISAPVSAAEEKKAEKAPSAQQNRMKDCNKDAGEKKLKGDERKAFMSTCLKGDSAGAAKASDSGCEAKAVSKDGKPLHGAAKANSIKKCEADAKAAAKPAEAKAEPKAEAKAEAKAETKAAAPAAPAAKK